MWFEAGSAFSKGATRLIPIFFLYMYKWYYLSINFTHSKCVIKTHMSERHGLVTASDVLRGGRIMVIFVFKCLVINFISNMIQRFSFLYIEFQPVIYFQWITNIIYFPRCLSLYMNKQKKKNHSIGWISSNLMTTLIRLGHWNANNSIQLRVRGWMKEWKTGNHKVIKRFICLIWSIYKMINELFCIE